MYRVEWTVFNAADFGVPQVRHRVFIVATAMDLPEYQFPTPTHSKAKLLQEQASGAYWERRRHPRPRMSRRGASKRRWRFPVALGHSQGRN